MKKYLPHVFLLMIAALPSLAAIIGPLPVTLTNGTTADANQVMSDFNKILNDVNANAAPLATTPQLNLSNTYTFQQIVPNATVAGAAVNAGQIQQAGVTYFSDTGTANALVATPIPAWTSYQAGQTITLNIKNANTGATTLNVSALGAKNVLTIGGQTLAASAVVVSQVATFQYDGTQFRMTSASDDANTQSFGNATNLLATTQYAISAVQTQGANISSVSNVNLDASTGDYVHITGTTNITAMQLSQGKQRTLVFDSSGLVLTNGASLILPTASSVVTIAGDTAQVRGEAAGVVRFISYNSNPASIGSSMVLLSSKTASSSATLNFGTADFDWATYDEYEFHFINLLPASNGAILEATISENGGSSFIATANYTQVNQIATGSAMTVTTGSAQSNMQLTGAQSSTTTFNRLDGLLKIYRPSETGHNKSIDLIRATYINSGSSATETKSMFGVYSGDTNAINGISFFESSGNIASGTIIVYGIRKQ